MSHILHLRRPTLLLAVTFLLSACTTLAATWTTQTSGTIQVLRGIWGTSSSSIWVVGGSSTTPVILKYNGTAWSAQTAPSGSYRLIGIWGADASNLWACGSAGTIVRTTDGGATWSAQTPPEASGLFLDAIWGTSATNIWVGGQNGIILHWDGTGWSSVTSPATGRFRGMWGSSATDIWGVTDTPEIVHYNGTDWSSVSQSLTTQPLFSVFGLNATNVYAASNSPAGGQPAILKWDGSAWSMVTRTGIPSGTLNNTRGIVGSATDRLWICNDQNGYIGYWDGTTWSTETSGTPNSFQAIWMAPAGNYLVAVAAGGVITTLSPQSDTTAPTVTSIVRQTPTSQALGAGTTSATFRVTFSEAVNTPANANFAVVAVNSSTIVGTITSVTAVSSSVYDVVVAVSSGSGEFRLKVID